MMEKVKKVISIILVMLTIFSGCSVVMPVFAQEIVFSDDDYINDIVETEEEPYILSEDLTKREENVKHFLMSDGSFVAAQYDSPIHYVNSEGEWVEYDNSLSEVEATEEQVALFGETELYTTGNETKNVVFAPKSNSNTLVSYEAKNYPISFNYQSAKKSYIKVDNKDLNLKGNDAHLVLPNVSQEVLYEDVFNDVDLQYVVSPGKLKENIILKSSEAENTFTVNYNIGELNAEIVDPQTINLTSGETVIYTISAPYMYDSNGETSKDLTMTVTKNKNGKLKIDLTADSEWLKDESRVYPVVIDPTITTETTGNGLSVTTQNIISDSTSSLTTQVVGYKSNLGKMAFRVGVSVSSEGYLNNCYITSANLKFVCYTKPTSDMYLNVYEATSTNNSWSGNTIINCGSEVVDYCKVTSTSEGCEFDITTPFKQMYETGTAFSKNFIVASFDNIDSTGTYCTFRTNSTSPLLTVRYRNAIGLEDDWSFTSLDCRSAGTVNINNYTGNLAFTYNENSSFDIASTYNSMCSDESLFGYMPNKTSSSLTQHIKSTKTSTLLGDVSSEAPYIYVDEDGTEHYFEAETNATSAVCSDSGLTLTANTATNTYELTKTDEEGGVEYKTFTIQNSIAVITKEGYRTSTEDTLYYTYNNTATTSGTVDLLTDESGNKLSYSIATSGTTKTATFYENGRFIERYTYTNGYLTSALFNDGSTATYTYTNGNLTSVEADDGYRLEFEYTNNKVTQVKEYDSDESVNGDDVLGQTITFTREPASNRTVIRIDDGYSEFDADDDSNANDSNDDVRTTYSFDNSGKLITSSSETVSGDSLGAVAYEYSENTEEQSLGSISKISASGQVTENLLKNHGMEVDSDWTSYKMDDNSCTYTASHASTQAHSGNSSYKITVNDFTQTGAVSYYQRLDVGAGGVLEAGETYTASVYIKTDGVVRDESSSEGRSYGAAMIIRTQTGTTGVNSYSEIVQATDESINNGWERVFLTFTVPADATRITMHLALRNATGTVYFDSAQVEKCDFASDYNLLENNGFTYYGTNSKATNWLSHNLTSSDVVSDGAMKIIGDPTANKGVYQEVNLKNASQKDTYVLGGWVEADPVPHKSGRAFALYPIVCYSGSTHTEKKEVIYFNSNYENSQFTCGSFDLSSATYPDLVPEKIRFIVCYYKEENTAFFDRVNLVKSENVYDLTETETTDTSTDSETTEDDYYTYNDDGSIATYTDENGVVYTYSYDGSGNVLSILDAEGNGYIYTYYSNGDVASETTVENGVTTVSEYDSSGKLTKETVTENGVSTEYGYTYGGLDGDSLLRKTKDGTTVEQYDYAYINFDGDSNNDVAILTYEKLEDGTENTYTYNAGTTKLSKQVYSKDGTTLTYNYDVEGRISSVDHNDFSYVYTYDAFNNNTSVSAEGNTLVSNDYYYNGTVKKSTYGNGDSESYAYNAYGELKRKTFSTTDNAISWRYDYMGRLIYERNNVIGQKTYYCYDDDGRYYGELVNSADSSNVFSNKLYSSYNSLDANGNVTKNSLTAGDKTYDTSYIYNDNGDVTATTISASRAINYCYDDYKLISKTTTTATPLAESFTYYVNGYVATHVIGSDTYGYTYDNNGNITQITKNGAVTQSYVYDANNQLVRENNVDTNSTILYYYDNGGNMLSKTSYDYTTDETPSGTSHTGMYTYDSDWNDKLLSYKGMVSTYDSMGNPLEHRELTFTWEGRQLKTARRYGVGITYQYDSDGLRTQKVVDGVQYDYYYVDGQLRYEKKGSEYELYYRYDTNGSLVSITRYSLTDSSAATYYAVANTRGDIIELRSDSGAVYAKYTYDSWGKLVSITNSSGTAITDSSNIAVQNSIRYRGYVYDTETGLYYLQSRYYDPEIGRFLNADDVDYIGASETVLSYNAFVYCENNAVNGADYTGNGFTLVFGTAAVSIYATYKAMMVAITGILMINTMYIMYKSGVFNVLGNALYEYVRVLKTNAQYAIDQLKNSINKSIEKAKTKVKTFKTNKHHIIARTASKAKIARDIWTNELKYSINDPVNLIVINYNLHIFLHNNTYYESINIIIKTAFDKKGRKGVESAMGVLRNLISVASTIVSGI